MRTNVGTDYPACVFSRVPIPFSEASGTGHCGRQDTGRGEPRVSASMAIPMFLPASLVFKSWWDFQDHLICYLNFEPAASLSLGFSLTLTELLWICQ